MSQVGDHGQGLSIAKQRRGFPPLPSRHKSIDKRIETLMKPTQFDLMQCDQERHNALLKADTAALDALFTDDLIYLHSTAVADNKQVFLEGLRTGKTRYLTIAYQPDQYRLGREFAQIFGKVDMQLLVDGVEKEVRALIISTWRFENERWRMMTWQATKQI